MSKSVFDMKKILVIVGPTASGKSALAVKLAQKINGEVISADSRQIYKGLDIGAGKITKKEMRSVVHWGLDIVSPKKRFTVSDYKKYADKKIKEILKRGKVPIICGGTGFYIDAVVKGTVFPEVKPNLKLRKKLSFFSAIALFKELKKLDPKRAGEIAKQNAQNNRVRIIRAIEIATALGKVPKIIEGSPRYQFIKIGISVPKEELQKKIEKRVKQMFKTGLLKEIQKLKKAGVSDKRLREFGFEYNSPTIESVILGSIQYAKRQMTWFKRDKDIIWFSLPFSSARSVELLGLVKSRLQYK